MDREKIITVIIGLLVGILLASGYFLGSKYLPKISQSKTTKSSLVAKSDNQQNVLGTETFSVDAPNDNSSTQKNLITFSGKAQPGSTIILFGNADEKIATADGTGNFKTDFKLEEGDNEISLTNLSTPPQTIKRSIVEEIVP